MNHLEIGELESRSALGLSTDDRSWSRFYDASESTIGGNLDGDYETNGYSIDECYDYWRAGKSVEKFIATVKARPHFSLRND